LYRARWQIEIAFKRLKSLFHYNDLPEKREDSIRAWFYGKLLLAALCETLVNIGRFSPSGETLPQKRFAAY
jgi:IS4 transposase